MWPRINYQTNTLEGFKFRKEYSQDNLGNSTIIKEMIMIYADPRRVEYNKSDVALVVSYDTDFGLHTIIFSKIQNLQYKNSGIEWIATYSSMAEKPKSNVARDDGKYTDSKVLTAIFLNTLDSLPNRERDIQDSLDTILKIRRISLNFKDEFITSLLYDAINLLKEDNVVAICRNDEIWYMLSKKYDNEEFSLPNDNFYCCTGSFNPEDFYKFMKELARIQEWRNIFQMPVNMIFGIQKE